MCKGFPMLLCSLHFAPPRQMFKLYPQKLEGEKTGTTREMESEDLGLVLRQLFLIIM